MDTVVMVAKGGVILRTCLLSLKSLPKNLKSKIPLLVSMPNTKVNIVNCELRGNDHNMTAGALFINSDVVMSTCKLTNFRAGGIFCVSHKDGKVLISDCELTKCSIVGVYSQGDEAKQFYLRLKIDNIDGPGIRVHKGN